MLYAVRMEQHRKFLEELKVTESKKLFEVALDLMMRKNDKNNSRLEVYKSLNHQEKINITKIIKFLNYAGFSVKKKNEEGIESYLKQSTKLTQKDKDFVAGILQVIEFDKTLNNYRLVVDQDKTISRPWIERKTLQQLSHKIIHNFENVEWKIEVILSSIAMKRVSSKTLRPTITSHL